MPPDRFSSARFRYSTNVSREFECARHFYGLATSSTGRLAHLCVVVREVDGVRIVTRRPAESVQILKQNEVEQTAKTPLSALGTLAFGLMLLEKINCLQPDVILVNHRPSASSAASDQ